MALTFNHSFPVACTTATLFFGISEGLMNRLLSVQKPSGRWYSTFRPHNAGAPSATVATGTPTRRLQGCDARS